MEDRESLVQATFLGGPWDMHRVWMRDTPPKFEVPIMERRLGARTTVIAEEHGEPLGNLVKRAMYIRADWRGYGGKEQERTIYVYTETR